MKKKLLAICPLSLVAFATTLEGWPGIPLQHEMGDYIASVSDNTGGNVAQAGTFTNPSRNQHKGDIYDVRVAPRGPTATPTATPVCMPGSWQPIANMPSPVYGAAGASDGTYFYVASGLVFAEGLVATFRRYDPVSDTWTPLADMPMPAFMALAVYYPPTDKIYVFGGEDLVGNNYNITRIYDIASDTWTTGLSMLDLRSFMAGGYVPATGKIYLMSGYRDFSVFAWPNTWEYDPVTNTWTDLTPTAPFPHPAGGFAYGVIGNKLYIAGGRDSNNVVINNTWEYDPMTNTYTAKASEPGIFQNNAPGSAVAQGRLWVFGGGNPFLGAVASKEAPVNVPTVMFNQAIPATASEGRYYDPATDTWTSSPNLTAVRSFPSSATIGDSLIIAAGGYNGSNSLNTAEIENVCQSGTPSPTATATPTATPSPTVRPVPTPRLRPTPAPRRSPRP